MTAAGEHPFEVHLTNFSGPFDLLLQLIAKKKLDVTEVALGQVTDDFVAHVAQMGSEWDLDQISSFLLVAATLLDLKAARLLPSGEVDDQADLAVLEARDLLFARLLQYRAYKQVSFWIADRLDTQSRYHAHPGGLEERFRTVLPDVEISVQAFVAAAVAAFARPPEPQMPLEQLHLPQVSVVEQARIVVDRLQAVSVMSFRDLVKDADRLVTVARFLALLELFRRAQVSFEQFTPLGELTIRWTGGADRCVDSLDEYDSGYEEDLDER